jgi:hypothetical protein
MKKFALFLSEAKGSQAVMQAKRLGLTSDEHGGWYDKNGEFTAKTVGGKLKFYNQNQVLGRQDPPQDRTPTNQQPVATQTQSRPTQQTTNQPLPQDQSATEEEPVEDKGVLTIAFGRFNPPTTGHEKLLDTVATIAGKGEYKIYPSRSNDPKKNPLDPDTKISVMRQMFPKYGEKIVNDEKFKTIFDVLQQAHSDGFSGVNIVVGADRQAEFEKLATKYNGDLYDFAELNVVSAGERDPDAEDVTGMSASKLRKAAAEGDFETFRKGTPKTLGDKETRKLFMSLRKSMKIEEDFNIWEIAPKSDIEGLRESYLNNQIFTIGEWVENLNTGLIGRVIRRGTNYLICVTEDNIMFKPWIKDVMEIKDIEIPSKNLKKLVKKAINRTDDNIDGFVDGEDSKTGPYGAFIPQLRNIPKGFKMRGIKEWTDVCGVPAKQREVGTDSHRKYTMKMTGTKKINNFNIKNFINKLKKK